MLNKVTIMGRLTTDPECRSTPNGVVVTNFRLAVERDFKDKQSGERETDFFDVTVWRHQAEWVANYLTRGQSVIVDGRLESSVWTDSNNVKHYNVKIIGENLYFAGSKKLAEQEASEGENV